MRLSEAIRLGAMMNPQGFGYVLDEQGRTCALGAAMEAASISTDSPMLSESYPEAKAIAIRRAAEIRAAFPAVDISTSCPACARAVAKTVSAVIVHLNDDHRFTREQIADWVQTIEDARSASDNGDQRGETPSSDAVRQTVEQPVASIRV